MTACYEIVSAIKKVAANDAKLPLAQALASVFPELDTSDAKLRFLRKFDDAIEEISFIPSLPDQVVRDLMSQVQEIQGKILHAITKDTVAEFTRHAHPNKSIGTLNLIGHTVVTARIPVSLNFDRQEFTSTLDHWLGMVEQSDLPPIQKAVITLKMRALLRFLTECRGATEDQIRLKLKSLASDIEREISEIDARHKPFLEKLKEAITVPIKHGRFALALASEVMTAGSLLGGGIAYLLPETPQLALPPPIENGDATQDKN